MHWASCARKTLGQSAPIPARKPLNQSAIPAHKGGGETHEVRVDVGPAGHDVAAGGVDLLGGIDVEARADGQDLAVLDRDVAHERGPALRKDGAQLEERPESVMGFAEQGGRCGKTPSTRGGGLGARAKG